jgi:hypothetical protein
MTLRKSFQPLRPDLDGFLFAAVGDERDGIPLSMISALTRLGLDPWHEAGRLSSLSKREAIEQLARLIAELPGACRPLAEARQIAGELVERLPKPGTKCPAPSQIKRPWRPWRQRWPAIPRQSQFFVLCIVVAAAALFSILLHRGF